MDVTGVNVTSGEQYWPWDAYQFSFLPTYRQASLDTDKTGVDNFVYKIYLEDASDQFFYASDPQKTTSNRQVKWDFDHVRVHTPAEHTFNGTQYDLEMQIFHLVSFIPKFIFVGQRKNIIDLSSKSSECNEHFLLRWFNLGKQRDFFFSFWLESGPEQDPSQGNCNEQQYVRVQGHW